MTLKINTTSPIGFKKNTQTLRSDKSINNKDQIRELGPVTPDFAVQMPQKYSKLGVKDLPNGLKVHSYKLANGHRVSIVHMEGSPTSVKNYVNVGSMNEPDNIKGISHFLEHMAFNGTTGKNGYIKLNEGDTFKNIEKLGGWTNASTSFAVTDYVNESPLLNESDLEKQIQLIAAMTEDLALTPEMIEKEKGTVCSEVNRVLDRPETTAFDQSIRTLFNIKSSADNLVIGSTDHIKNLTQKDIKDYYNKYYTPDNMNLVITGDIDPEKAIEIVAKNFHSKKTRNSEVYYEKLEPIEKTVRKDFISDKATSTTTMLTFVGPKNNDTKSKIIFDIIYKHLGSREVGIFKKLEDINASAYYDINRISNNPNNPTLICYQIDSGEENSEKALKIIFDKLSTLRAPSKEKLEIIKEKLLLDDRDNFENSEYVNMAIGSGILDGSFDDIDKYEEILNSITQEDINEFIDKYIDLNKTAITVVHPQTTPEAIQKRYNEASNISFKGQRKAINTTKVQETTLENNYKVGFYETKSDNVTFRINLTTPIDSNISPAAIKVFFHMIGQGTEFQTEDDLIDFYEQNNVDIYTALNSCRFAVLGKSNTKNFEKAINKTKEIISNPRFTQENLDKAKSIVQESIKRKPASALGIFANYESKNNKMFNSTERILKELDTITLDDVKAVHQHFLNNSTGLITMNVPEKHPEIKNIATEVLKDFTPVNEYKITCEKTYTPNNEVVVLTKEKKAAQADITESFKFKYDDNVQNEIKLNLINSLLSSSSIGLFDTLREKEQLAYAVGSEYETAGDSGYIHCYIQTTTDNKEIGEISYDNVQRSINGFNRQIGALLNSEYTDEDLENAKKQLKAGLLSRETTHLKLSALENSLESELGPEHDNIKLVEIDKITREDIDKYAWHIFNKPPVYSIVGSKDTLEANKDFFETL